MSGADISGLAVGTAETLYASSRIPGTIYRSTDSGFSWNPVISPGLTLTNLAIHPNRTIFASTLGGVFRSTNGGGIWTQIGFELENGWVDQIAFNSSGDIFAGAVGGIYRSTDNGSNWNKVNNGLPASIICLAVNSNGDILPGVVVRYSAPPTKEQAGANLPTG